MPLILYQFQKYEIAQHNQEENKHDQRVPVSASAKHACNSRNCKSGGREQLGVIQLSLRLHTLRMKDIN